MWLYNEQVLKTPKSLVVDGVTYPSSVFRDADLLATLGVTAYSETGVDERYYWTGERTITDGVGTYAAIPRDVDTLKEGMMSTINSQVSSRQGQVDWYWNRASKGGKAVPTNIQTYVDTLYSEQATKETEVQALTTLADIIAYEATPFTEVRKVKHTSDEGVETYGPETEEPMTRHMNMLMHWTVNPMDDVDPAFVSLTENN